MKVGTKLRCISIPKLKRKYAIRVGGVYTYAGNTFNEDWIMLKETGGVGWRPERFVEVGPLLDEELFTL